MLFFYSCPTDRTVQYHKTVIKQEQRFSLKAFQFVNVENPEFVYIHCTVVVCNATDINSMCNKDCYAEVTNRYKRSIRYSRPVHVDILSQGPIFKPNKKSHTGGM